MITQFSSLSPSPSTKWNCAPYIRPLILLSSAQYTAYQIMYSARNCLQIFVPWFIALLLRVDHCGASKSCLFSKIKNITAFNDFTAVLLIHPIWYVHMGAWELRNNETNRHGGEKSAEVKSFAWKFAGRYTLVKHMNCCVLLAVA